MAIFPNYIEGKIAKMSKTDYRLKLTNLECHGDNDYVVNFTCFIKPGRDKAGFMTMKQNNVKPLDKFIAEIRHFYKPVVGRNPQYRPYLFNLDLDW